MKKLGLRGAAVGASCAGEEFSDPKFHPFWAKAEELGVLIFIHPQSTPELAQALQGQRLARQHHRQPARHHDLPVAPHLRRHARPLPESQDLLGARRRLSCLRTRRAPTIACRVAPWHCDPDVKLKKKPTEYLKTMYYDTLVFTSEMLRHLAARSRRRASS